RQQGESVMKAFVVGGAGFIGSHLVRRLLATKTAMVTVYDDFSSGRTWHLGPAGTHSGLSVVRADVKDVVALTAAMAGHEVGYHRASNPDIGGALQEPEIDFWAGTYLTQNVLEAMRRSAVRKIIYASGSGVYGDQQERAVAEHHGPLQPVSTYGA